MRVCVLASFVFSSFREETSQSMRVVAMKSQYTKDEQVNKVLLFSETH